MVASAGLGAAVSALVGTDPAEAPMAARSNKCHCLPLSGSE